MFKAVAQVRDGLMEIHGGGHVFTLQEVVEMFENVSIIDEVVYVRFDVPATNPIWGGFQKWSRQPGVYKPFITTVEVRYAAHLDERWRKFVVCKELCHALEAYEGTYSVTDSSIEGLVAHFALISARASEAKGFNEAITAEYSAEMCAMEILCPVSVRKGMIEAGDSPAKIADDYQLPEIFMELACRPAYMAMIEKVLAGA